MTINFYMIGYELLLILFSMVSLMNILESDEVDKYVARGFRFFFIGLMLIGIRHLAINIMQGVLFSNYEIGEYVVFLCAVAARFGKPQLFDKWIYSEFHSKPVI